MSGERGTRAAERVTADLARLLPLVLAKPYRTAGYYAKKADLSPAYARRLLHLLAEAGHLRARRSWVYAPPEVEGAPRAE